MMKTTGDHIVCLPARASRHPFQAIEVWGRGRTFDVMQFPIVLVFAVRLQKGSNVLAFIHQYEANLIFLF
jgi:hypothetical protein